MATVPPMLSTEELLKNLEEQHQAYLKTFQLVHQVLSQAAQGVSAPSASTDAQPAQPTQSAPSRRRRRSTLDISAEAFSLHSADRKPSTYRSSVLTGESDESDADDELYVQTPLPKYKFDKEDLRKHLKTYEFNEYGKTLLKPVVQNGRLRDPTALFPKYPPEENWHNSHYSVFDVGRDGAPLNRHDVVEVGSSMDSAIWQAISDLNANPAAQRPAVGRITIIREPSPIILGAIHLTMNKDFDMDELFGYLAKEDNSAAHVLNRAFDHDQRHQRSFAFKFDYYTIVEEDIQSMPWQRTDLPSSLSQKPPDHIPISRCSSVLALSLAGGQVRKLRNAARKAKTQYGYVYDPWSPWHVLNIQCYPDHKHSIDSHDSTKHYINGPEAFLHTLLAEFKDAEKRFDDIYNKISKLVIPPADFMFNGDLRDKLLFEDDEFTYSRRYFWAFQTLGIMSNSIKSIIDAYEDTFTDEVWEGKHKSLWPMIDEDSPRNIYARKRMAHLRKEFEKQIKALGKIWDENDDRRKEIRTLRDQLFSGTSVLESRKSVVLSEVTILQGHNIKLLTLVSIFFLPLTFVTSVFGMTNMSTDHQFKAFGITMATVCVPFFFLIGALNTTKGMEFWRSKWQQIFDWISFRGSFPQSKVGNGNPANGQPRKRSLSASETRLEIHARPRFKSAKDSSASLASSSKVKEASGPSNQQVEQINSTEAIELNGDDSSNSTGTKQPMPVITSISSAERIQAPHPVMARSLSWWEKLAGRPRTGRRQYEHNV